MSDIAPDPAAPRRQPGTLTTNQLITHLVAVAVAALGTAYFERPATPPTVPVVITTPGTADTPAKPPQTAPSVATTPAPAAMDPTATVLKVGTLRIEAGTVQLVGNVTVSIPEIKPPNVIVENKLPQAVLDALMKPTPTPQVSIQNYIDPTTLKPPAIGPQIITVPATQGTPIIIGNGTGSALMVPDAAGEIVPAPPKGVIPPTRVLPQINGGQ